MSSSVKNDYNILFDIVLIEDHLLFFLLSIIQHDKILKNQRMVFPILDILKLQLTM